MEAHWAFPPGRCAARFSAEAAISLDRTFALKASHTFARPARLPWARLTCGLRHSLWQISMLKTCRKGTSAKNLSAESTDKSAKLTSGEAPFEPIPLCPCSWAELQPHSIRCIATCLIGIRYWITSSSDLPSDRQGVPLPTCLCAAHLWHPCLSRKCEGQQGRPG